MTSKDEGKCKESFKKTERNVQEGEGARKLDECACKQGGVHTERHGRERGERLKGKIINDVDPESRKVK